MVRTFDATEAASLTATPRTQLDYFVRAGVITPAVPASRRGVSRRYNAKDLFEISVACELLDAGVSIVEIGAALKVVRADWPALTDKRRRDRVGVLALVRRARGGRHVLPQLVKSAELGDLADKGYTIVVAVPVAYFARTIEAALGESLQA